MLEIKKNDDRHIILKHFLKFGMQQDFFHSTLNWYPFHAYLMELNSRISPIPRSTNENNRNPIDNQILYELDEAFSDKNVPLHVKTVYWFIRLFLYVLMKCLILVLIVISI